MRERLGIPEYDPANADGEMISLMKAAERLGICVGSAKSLVLKGILSAKQILPSSPWLVPVEALASEEVRIEVQRVTDAISSSDCPDSDEGMHYETSWAHLP